MKEKLLKILKYAVYPLVYFFSLVLFGYWTFPFNRLKDRVVAEFDKTAKPGQRLEIGDISRYWFSGLDLKDVKLVLPPSNDAPASPFGAAQPDASSNKETTITVDDAHVRVRLLPLLIGRVRADFGASLLGGEITGNVPVGAVGDVSVEWEGIELGKVEPLSAMLAGLPIKGAAKGTIEIQPVEGKFQKASGTLSITIAGVTIGDGKTKVLGVDLPTARVGDFTIEGDAKDGVLKITKLATTGPDVEVVGDGRITMREPADQSQLDLYVRFKFSDAFRGKNDTTKSFLGDPNSSIPPLLEMSDPRMKRSKRPDGFYGWHVYGSLKNPKFEPSTADSKSKPGGTGPAMSPPGKRPSLSFPLGTSAAAPPRGEVPPAPTNAAPPAPAAPDDE